ncbi:MAG: hypothetical protein IPJ33_22430 [Gammaproteobacteria bacterium]|nr:hypothetical protein [Gammaproteobacteria bacterium]
MTDPLVAMVSSIDRSDLGVEAATNTFREHLNSVKKVTNLVAKRAAIAGVKAVTLGILDIDEGIEAVASNLAGEAVGDIVDAFNRESELIDKFRVELTAAVDQLPTAGKEATMVFFIDELDRCRPNFAIEMLERMKHLFDIPNIVFVLSVDKQQLESSTAAVYGAGINAAEYLRRFIDLEYGIPPANAKRYTEHLMTRFALDPVFAERKSSEGAYDKENFVKTFTLLADAMKLSLRARERCIVRLRVVMDQTQSDQHLDPILVALLIVLRSSAAPLFQRLISGEASAEAVMEYLESLPGGIELVKGRTGLLIHAFLLAADRNQDRAREREAQLRNDAKNDGLSEVARRRAAELLDFKGRIEGGMRMGIRLAPIAAKVDLAAMLRD